MITYRFEGAQAAPETLRYTVVKPDAAGTPYALADVQSLTLYVYDLSTGLATTPTGGVALTVANCLVTGQAYNMVVTVQGVYFPQANRTYRVEVRLTPTSGTAFVLGFVEKRTVQTYSAGA